jgi:hypothetical protein
MFKHRITYDLTLIIPSFQILQVKYRLKLPKVKQARSIALALIGSQKKFQVVLYRE